MKNFLLRLLLASALFFLPALFAQAAAPKTNAPKLVVVLVVDQFRADFLTRFKSRLMPAQKADGSPGGYRYLIAQGAYFPFAQYDVLQNMTGPGHSMILSGAYPYQSGIPINEWFEPGKEKSTYCVEDKNSAILGRPEARGLSPKNLAGSTVGDELKNAGYPSRVVTISIKDRASILMGGRRADLVLWLDSSFRWVTSRYYLPTGDLPAWVEKENAALQKRKDLSYPWFGEEAATGLSGPPSGNFFREAKIGSKTSLSFPFGLEITANLAKSAVDALQLGSGTAPDLLAVSFSSHDYMGHYTGPNSREMEEMTVAEDRVIADFLAHLKKKIPGGLKDVAIVLTADHGTAPNAEWIGARKIDAGRIDAADLMSRLNTKLTEKFGASGAKPWIYAHADFNFYLNQEAAKKVDLAALEKEVQSLAEATPGIKYFFSRSNYASRKLPPGQFERQILKTYFPGRSGDFVLIPQPFYYLKEEEYPTGHITGYAYDRTVPLIFTGRFFRKGVYANHADIVDVAPTLSYILGLVPPALSEGRVLNEISPTLP